MTDQFKLGRQAGREAMNDPDTFEVSQWNEDYTLGFVIGRGAMQASQATYSYGARVIGELGAKYGLPLEDLLEQVEDNTLHSDVREGYGAGEGEGDF